MLKVYARGVARYDVPMTRRTVAGVVVVVLTGAIALVLALAVRSPGAGEPEGSPASAPPRYNESPVLRERVERGELPPVEERLPLEPMVVTPFGEIGRYDSDPPSP